jgi:hypothetical protein
MSCKTHLFSCEKGLRFVLLRQKLLINGYDTRVGGVVISMLTSRLKGIRVQTLPRRWVFRGDKNP